MIKDQKDKDVKIMYFDTETVTLESPAESCAFFQFSGIIEINGKEVERFDFFMNPNHSCEYDPDSLAFNEITEDDLEVYDDHTEVFPKVVEMLERHVNRFDKNDKMHTVGFNNIAFDNPKLWNWFACNDELKRKQIQEAYNKQMLKYERTGDPEDKPGRMEKVYNTFGSFFWTDTKDVFPMISLVFMKYRNLFKNFKLQTVAEKLSVMGLIDSKYQKSENWHDALFDIEATRDLFHFCLRMFKLDFFNEE
jgi:DNA polymerase III alpha subunit (gram-positive type)